MTSTHRMADLVGGHRGRIGAAVTLVLVASAMGLAQPLVARRLIESAEAGVAPEAVVLVGLLVGQALVEAAGRYVLARSGERVVLDLRVSLVAHLLRLSMPVYDRKRIGDLISVAGTDTAVVRRLVVDGIANLVAGALGVVGAVALMLWLDPILLALVAAVALAGFAVTVPALRAIRSASLDHQQATGAMASDLERALSAVRTVRASQAEQRETDRLAAHARSVCTAGLRMARLDVVIRSASQLAVGGSFLGVVLVGGVRAAAGDGSVADLVAFLLAMQFLLGPLSAVFDAASSLQQAAGALQRIERVHELPRESSEPEEAGGAPAPAPRVVPAPRPGGHRQVPLLELRDVWFGYDPTRPVLRGLSFQVPVRGRVALVGRSGAGKTTVLALIERFYEPDGGSILFGGQDVSAIPRAEVRARIGLVEQHCPVLQGTVRDNLVYADPEVDDEDIHRAVELARLTELLSGLPRGLDTTVGDHGMTLSGGERQRLAIARALVRRPQLLLLDEPTAQLDRANAAAIGRTVEEISAECAVLVAAHRRSTIQGAHQIVRLDADATPLVTAGANGQHPAGPGPPDRRHRERR